MLQSFTHWSVRCCRMLLAIMVFGTTTAIADNNLSYHHYTTDQAVAQTPPELTYEFDDFPLPPLPSDYAWSLDEAASDEFKYSGKTDAFYSKWWDNNGPQPGGAGGKWYGPGETIFVEDQATVQDGKLVIKASRYQNPEKPDKHIQTAYVASKRQIQYPVYFESRIKVNGLTLASNFWAKLGDIDNKTEIDVTESYGWGKHNTGSHYNMNTNWHDFRNGNNSDQKNISTHKLPSSDPLKGQLLRDHYFVFGCYWKSATEIEWYLNGVKVRSTKDPGNKPISTPFNEKLRIIFDVESHEWLSRQGYTATDAELNDESRNKMYVDWVRTYKPVPRSNELISDGTYHVTSATNNQRLLAAGWDNHNARMTDPANYNDQRWIFTHLGNSLYTIENKGTGRFLEVPYGTCNNDTNVATHTEATADHQRWKVEKNGDKHVFKPAHCLSHALDRAGGQANANVHIWEFSSSNINQQWHLTTSG